MKKVMNTITYPAFALFAFACFALSPQARAVCQEGCDLVQANTFLGDFALINNTTGFANTAVGARALSSNTTGHHNTAIGTTALSSNTIGFENTATGVGALNANTTGIENTATGVNALVNNTDGFFNTATGNALFSNRSGFSNTATGWHALGSNINGGNNTANGVNALFSNAADRNTATGVQALTSNTTGSGNIALGFQAGLNLTTGSNNIDIGNAGVAGESNKIRIGTEGTQRNAFIAGIYSTPVARGLVVKIDSTGHLGTVGSSGRFKEQIKPMGNASEAILGLKPVTFRYKKEIDPERTPEFGLVAEDVAKVNPDLVVRDAEGKVYTVRYDAVNAMLLNEFLKEHKTVQEQGAMIAGQQKQIAALTAGLQKVSAQLEVRKPAPQTVLNNQ